MGALGFMLGGPVLLAAWLAGSHAQASVPEDHPDASATATLGIDAPKALPLMEAGDAALAAGKFSEAAALFDSAAKLSPKSGMLRRKQCEALAGAGRRREAIANCDQAYALGSRSAYDTRKMVAVRMAGKALPTSSEAFQAFDMASFAIRSDSSLPWGYAAMGEIANRLGDRELLARTLWQLQQLAPTHPETRALAQLADQNGSSAPSAIARLLLALLVVGTAGHWLLDRLKRSAPSAPVVNRVPMS